MLISIILVSIKQWKSVNVRRTGQLNEPKTLNTVKTNELASAARERHEPDLTVVCANDMFKNVR